MVTVVGLALITVGIPLVVLPGPAVLFFAAGLAVLGTEYHAARRLQRWVVARFLRLTARLRARHPKHGVAHQAPADHAAVDPRIQPPR